MQATASRTDEGIDVFSARSVAQGLGEWRNLSGPLKLYRAVVSRRFMLGEGPDKRVPVSP